MNTPRDIYNHIIENNLESDFIVAIMNHKNGYSIAEITDAVFITENGNNILRSNQYDISVEIEDEEIIGAIRSGLYVSSFISRFTNQYQVHFLVHRIKRDNKAENEDVILQNVLQYMIMKTIIALRLDTFEKVDDYIK